MRVWCNANAATMTTGGEPYGAIRDAALVTNGERIEWIGPRAALPAKYNRLEQHDAAGCWITPGLIDCHTHLVYGGNRSGEFEMRLNGASYEDIARAGGGIVSTVKATREADAEQLKRQALPRLKALLQQGVTTVEIKSGYGLETATELRMLEVAKALGSENPVDVQTSFLGAHALPPEFAGRADDYIACVCDEMMPAAANAGLADAVDAFCENIAFNKEQIEQVFTRAKSLGLPVKLHAEQLSNQGGAELAARHSALSADHLEYLDETGVVAMAKTGTSAVLLPGAFYFLRETKLPPVELLRKHRVPIALASDSNPGSSPVTSLLLMLSMGCTLFLLTPEEALAGVTRSAAQALGLGASHGTLAPGKVANLVLWDIGEPAELAYNIGLNPCRGVIYRGEQVALQ